LGLYRLIRIFIKDKRERKVMSEVDMGLAGEILTQAMYHGLEVEVVLEAMAMIKEDPSLDSTRALSMAAYEWDVLV